MDNGPLCDCTHECIGRHLCEIGTWMKPEPLMVQEQAREALTGLGDWLYSEPRMTTEIVSAIFSHFQFEESPRAVDLFADFYNALLVHGFTPSSDDILKAVWVPPCCADFQSREEAQESSKNVHPTLIRLLSVAPLCKPANFQRVLEFMVAINSEFLLGKDLRTSEIADMMFPGASKEVLDAWLTQAIDDCLCRVGFTPEGRLGDDKAGVFDDPYWWCDGDPKEMLRFNLWSGVAGHP